jgi:hypothetical protein
MDNDKCLQLLIKRICSRTACFHSQQYNSIATWQRAQHSAYVHVAISLKARALVFPLVQQ